MDAALTFTCIESTSPPVLTKKMSLVGGSLCKESVAQLTRGTARLTAVASLDEFGEFLDDLPSNRACLYGVAPGHAEATLTTKARIREGEIARTREFFQFAPQPGVMMLDHDGAPQGSITADELIDRLEEIAPCTGKVGKLWRPSASAGICAPDGRALTTAVAGQRIYLGVERAVLIPEAGAALVDLLWAAGYGWIKISEAGTALPRTLFDATVWQPERLDFAAPPVLLDGLTRKAPPPRLIGELTHRLDLRKLLASADDELRAKAAKARKQAIQQAQPECEQVRARWAEARAPALATARGIDVEQAKELLLRAAAKQELGSDFVLTTQDGAEVTVAEVLANPDQWHNKRFHDPLEPDYHKDTRIAVAYLRGGIPILHSHAHGGMRYELSRGARRVELRKGARARAVDETLDALRSRGELYEFGDTVARVTSGRICPISADWLLDNLDRVVQYRGVRFVQGETRETALDAPTQIAKAILAKQGERGFRPLEAVITLPTLRRDGSILDEVGYDAPSRLLLAPEVAEVFEVPAHPTVHDARLALGILWEPLHKFPLVDAIDRGVVLAALLTATLRAVLPVAPGFAIDAPSAGTGKTLLARAIGALGTGRTPAILPPVDRNDEEVRKRLFAALRKGDQVILLDNVRDRLGGAALDAFLTSDTFTDRVLGASDMQALPNRALFLATGNNLRLVGDTCRRILVARLDAQSEEPYRRTFDFDPVQTVLARRPALVRAALTIVRAWIAENRPRAAGGVAGSFEVWDALARQPACWIGAIAGEFGDPLVATERAFEHDPETTQLGAVLMAWHAVFHSIPVTVADLLGASMQGSAGGALGCSPEARSTLRQALCAVADTRGSGDINNRVLGRWIARQIDRRLGGFVLRRGVMRAGNQTWIVEVARR